MMLTMPLLITLGSTNLETYMEKARKPTGSQAPSGQTTLKQPKHLTVARRPAAYTDAAVDHW